MLTDQRPKVRPTSPSAPASIEPREGTTIIEARRIEASAAVSISDVLARMKQRRAGG